jgi:hypothetical protein
VLWQVFFHAEFEPEFDALEHEVQDELLAHANLLKEFAATAQAPYCRHFTWIEARQHEGVALQGMQAEFGALHLPSIPSRRPYCSSQETSQVAVRSAFTGNSSKWRTRGSTGTLRS